MISRSFVTKDSGQPRQCLGIDLDWFQPNRVTLFDSRLIESLLASHGVKTAKVTTCPMSPAQDVAENYHIQVSQEGKAAYCSIIGSLINLVIKTRPDIALSASVLGQFVENTTQNHVEQRLQYFDISDVRPHALSI